MTLSEALRKKLADVGVTVSAGVEKPVMISSGCLGLDIAMGGGLPRGRLTTIASADTGFGKTTMINIFSSAITNAPTKTMMNGGRVAIFDTERKYSTEWQTKMGANPEKVDLFTAVSGEAMMYAIFNMIKENAYDAIFVDTVKFTSFASQIEAVNGGGKEKNGFNKAFVAVAASHWSFFCNVVAAPLADSNVALVTLNHTSAVIGDQLPDTEYGGKSLPRLASIRIRLLTPRLLQSTDKSTGEIHDILTIRPNIIKNNFMQRRIIGTEIEIVDGIINPIADIIKFGKEFGVFTKEDGSIIKSGGKWHFDGQYLGKSEAEVKTTLLADISLYSKVYSAVSKLAATTSLPADSSVYTSDVEEGQNGAE